MKSKGNETGLEKMRGIYVEVRNNDLEGALKRLKKIIKKNNLMITIQENMYYTKPSAKRRDQKNKAKARQRSESKRAR